MSELEECQKSKERYKNLAVDRNRKLRMSQSEREQELLELIDGYIAEIHSLQDQVKQAEADADSLGKEVEMLSLTISERKL